MESQRASLSCPCSETEGLESERCERTAETQRRTTTTRVGSSASLSLWAWLARFPSSTSTPSSAHQARQKHAQRLSRCVPLPLHRLVPPICNATLPQRHALWQRERAPVCFDVPSARPARPSAAAGGPQHDDCNPPATRATPLTLPPSTDRRSLCRVRCAHRAGQPGVRVRQRALPRRPRGLLRSERGGVEGGCAARVPLPRCVFPRSGPHRHELIPYDRARSRRHAREHGEGASPSSFVLRPATLLSR